MAALPGAPKYSPGPYAWPERRFGSRPSRQIASMFASAVPWKHSLTVWSGTRCHDSTNRLYKGLPGIECGFASHAAMWRPDAFVASQDRMDLRWSARTSSKPESSTAQPSGVAGERSFGFALPTQEGVWPGRPLRSFSARRRASAASPDVSGAAFRFDGAMRTGPPLSSASSLRASARSDSNVSSRAWSAWASAASSSTSSTSMTPLFRRSWSRMISLSDLARPPLRPLNRLSWRWSFFA
mmetsp:Transcript_11321/g.34938  ORF Transcript_11321/g.34938 Transcript_11321/m.34938 type:complete len:240 (-) Transcript_11321:1286-2005(-)